jgi:hypothetical protein
MDSYEKSLTNQILDYKPMSSVKDPDLDWIRIKKGKMTQKIVKKI